MGFACGVVGCCAVGAEEFDGVEFGVVVVDGEGARARRVGLVLAGWGCSGGGRGVVLHHCDAVVALVPLLIVPNRIDVVLNLVKRRTHSLCARDKRLLVASTRSVLRHQRVEIVRPIEIVVRGRHQRGAMRGLRHEELAGLRRRQRVHCGHGVSDDLVEVL